jgi:alkylated DNA repair dioxygenase AlkB
LFILFFYLQKICLLINYHKAAVLGLKPANILRDKIVIENMKLFKNEIRTNILPIDGIVNYYGKVISQSEDDFYLEKLLRNIEWKNDEAIIFGRHIITKRKVAWYGDKDFEYVYSNHTKYALLWTKELLQLKKIADEICETNFNSCLLNLYHNGDEGMAWHSDDEKTLTKGAAIASFSFGAERKFSLKHRQTKEAISILLEHGSLLEMKGTTQKHWLHCLPKSKKITQPRVNLTFRVMKESKQLA